MHIHGCVWMGSRKVQPWQQSIWTIHVGLMEQGVSLLLRCEQIIAHGLKLLLELDNLHKYEFSCLAHLITETAQANRASHISVVSCVPTDSACLD